MHHHPFLMFKSNPFKQQFQRYDGRSIRTLQIQNFSFLATTEIEENKNHNKICLKKPKDQKTSKSPQQNILKTICMDKTEKRKLEKNLIVKTPKNKHLKSPSEIVSNPKTKRVVTCEKHYKRKQLRLNPQKKQGIYSKINEPFSAREQKLDSLRDTGFSSFLSRTIINQAHEIVGKKKKLKQKLYQSIDFDNLFSKIQSQVTQFDPRKSPQNSPIMKDKLILLDKMKRYSKTPTSKARNVFDQFNLKYLINKRKNFNRKKEKTIKGSHLPYFQSFDSTETKSLSKYEKKQQIATSFENQSQKSPDLSQNHGESKQKMSSLIIIDDYGIVHEEENPQINAKDRSHMIQKISDKMINMRQILRIEKILPSSPR